MEDVQPGQAPNTAEVVQAATEQTVAGTESPQTERQGVGDLPEWARNIVQNANKQAAQYRAAAKQAEDAAKAKELAEAQQRGEFEKLAQTYKAELDAVRAEAEALKLGALRASVGQAIGLPAALTARLQGSTEDELKADALELIKAFPKVAMATDAGTGVKSQPAQPSAYASEADRIEKATRLGVNPRFFK